MNPADYLVLAVIVAILGCVIFYICRAKKKGVKCIGCPYAKECSGKCGCHNGEDNN
jgi:hypothetical protein